jgi:3-hydroxyacyl-CoA dehydrogenase/enoyl-CoA hydratase/3-hydroxybutyryl-CoA epimerase/3-hydroxyacyl-CoA dehydrogenase/enoyl-CoA hydratase/3-hydroxybutyryl-CoA epimerase/enoyl-CoA isomerase
MMSPALDNVRRLVEWSRRDNAVDGDAPLPIGRVGILGAGMMGTAIAAAHVQYQVPVVIHDVDPEALARAPAAVAAELRRTGIELPPSSLHRLVRTTADLAEVAPCDLVLEAIVEALPAKQRLYARLREHLGEHTIVASNTSTIPLERLAGGVSDVARFCGMHFLHPVRERPLVEVVRGKHTSGRTIATAVAHLRRIGRMPIVVEDGPGFVVNRLLFPYLGEALELLRIGTPAEAIERAAAEFGMALGPLRLMDEIGLDTTLRAGWVMAMAYPERIAPSPLLLAMVKAGRLGQKTGAGFYCYGTPDEAALSRVPDPAFAKTIAPWIEPSGQPPRERLDLRLVMPMLLEAARILEEGNVRDARAIDLAALFGLGFPADKGGLLWWANTFGLDRILAWLRSDCAAGIRCRPTPLLERLAAAGGGFYAAESPGTC